MSEYESLMNISLNAVLRSNADNPDMTLSPYTRATTANESPKLKFGTDRRELELGR